MVGFCVYERFGITEKGIGMSGGVVELFVQSVLRWFGYSGCVSTWEGWLTAHALVGLSGVGESQLVCCCLPWWVCLPLLLCPLMMS